jgi:subtilase family serine protease
MLPAKGTPMSPFRFARLAMSGLTMFALSAGMVRAQNTALAGKVALANAISPPVAKAKDLGEADGSQMLSMTLGLALTSAKEAALTKFLKDQQNPASQLYHRWLTPEEFRVQFGVDTEDLSAATEWLSAQGFTVTQVSRGGLFVRFSGTVAQAESAFAVQIHNVSWNGALHIANVTAPELPMSVASMTSALLGLDDFHPQPRGVVRQVQGNGGLHPEFTTAAGTHYLAPADFDTIYGVSNLLSSSVNGSGVSIAVIGQSDIHASDLTAFQTAAGLANVQPTTDLYGSDPGSASVADLNEAEMDLEWAHAAAPGATIVYVNSTDAIQGSLTEAIDNDLAPIVTTSYGSCEAGFGTNALAYFSELLQMGAAEGITITAAAGDSGATDCDGNVGSAVNGLAVDFPASSPLVTGVGGTEFSDGSGTYWTSSNSSTGGSATGYIPEVVWNDDNGAGLDAGGGGASDYFSKPAWQSGNGVPNDFSRDVPDVALAASINHDGYLICTGSNCTNGFANASGGYEVSGGTSAGAPAFAGLLALVEQQTGTRIGNANPIIYALANSSYAANVFHDITTGTNASPCTAGSMNCAAGGTIGFTASAGYDQASGWGSVNAYDMVHSWTLVTPVTVTGGVDPSVTTVAGSLQTAVVGTPILFTVTTASATTASTATPTGTVQMTVDGVAVGAAVALVNGTATYTLSTTGLSVGNHTVQATYMGDSSFAGSKGAFAISITTANGPDFSLTPPTANVTVQGGDIAQAVQFTVTSLGGYTGTVSFNASLVSPLAGQSSFSNTSVELTSASPSATTAFSLLAYTNTSRNAMTPKPGTWYRTGSGVLFAGMLLIFLPRRRKWAVVLVMLVSLGALGVSGCGSSQPSTPAATTIPTPTGTYTVLVQATANINGSTTAHTATITYVVQ